MSLQLKKILVPVDFSPYGEKAREMAKAIAAQFDGEIELVHVVERSPYEAYLDHGLLGDAPVPQPLGGGARTYTSQGVIDELIAEATTKLKKMAKAQKPPCKAQVRHGHVVEEVLEEIADYRPDLVVMGTHGWTGLKHLLLGSVAEKIVRLSPVPVLTTKAGDGK